MSNLQERKTTMYRDTGFCHWVFSCCGFGRTSPPPWKRCYGWSPDDPDSIKACCLDFGLTYLLSERYYHNTLTNLQGSIAQLVAFAYGSRHCSLMGIESGRLVLL